MPRVKATHYPVFFIASVHGTHFVDMLRYDNAVPANEAESYRLAATINGPADWIIFKRFVRPGTPEAPTAARWVSFGQHCLTNAFETFDEAEKFAAENVDRAKRAGPK